MAGTLFGLPLSQRVDLNSLPSVGWKLYLYQANTSTPVNSYSDQGLSILNPWPLVADGYGMMGEFWLADGSYRARGTSNDGAQTYFDRQNILALTPYTASTSAPSGPSIDASQIFNTGDVKWMDISGTITGWVRDNGRTIGSATSGATERANADCQNLFIFLWNNFGDTFCPVGGGRGASAAADFSANKQIATPDHRGCIIGGLDDMGNAAAGRYSGVPIILGGVTLAGSQVGETSHVLSSGEMPSHTHTANVTESPHTHTGVTAENVFATAGATTTITAGASGATGKAVNVTVGNSSTGLTVANVATGGGATHNNVQRSVLGTFYRKL
jgi:microcystin-dependent protein